MTVTASPPAPPQLPAGLVDALVTRTSAGRFGGPHQFDEQWKLAEGLAQARHAVPPIYRGSPGDILAVMQQAQALDVPLMLALQHFYFSADTGKGGMSAQLMSALLLRHGVTWQVIEKTDRRVAMIFSRSDGGPAGKVEWTILEAVAAGLIRQGSPWEFYPVDCLWARCLSRGARQFAADAVLGMGYVPEEVYAMSGTADPEVTDEVVAIKPEVGELLDGLGELDAAAARKRFDTARSRGLLDENAGVVDGSPQLLKQVLHDAWLAASHREAAAAADAALPAAPEHDAEPAEPAVAAAPLASAGTGQLGCGCDAQAVLRAGEHQEGCRA